VRFDPIKEQFQIFPTPIPEANVRQILGRQNEVWEAEFGTDKIILIRSDK
jgi:virginiamycin B lyase